MTPKEKAEELFDTYRYALSMPNAPLGKYKDTFAKQCASIAVDAIMDVLDKNCGGWDSRYWQKVKQEIENL